MPIEGGAAFFATVAVRGVDRATAVDAPAELIAPMATGAAVGMISIGVRTITPPHAGHRAFFPADVAGAFNFLPHEQRTVIVPSPAMTYPLSEQKSSEFEMTRQDDNEKRGSSASFIGIIDPG
jgi:hypothetical protein